MSINYPSSLDGTAQFAQPLTTSPLNAPDHAGQHDNLSSLGTVLENLLGTTQAQNALTTFVSTDKAARVNHETLGSPTTNSGTFNNPVIGTPSITGGTFNQGVMGSPTIQGGTQQNPFINTHTLGSAAWTGTASGTTTLDIGTASRQVFTFPNSAGSVTLAITNVVANMPFIVEIIQGTAGNGTIGWFSGITWAAGSAFVCGTTASYKDTLGFISTGTNTFNGYVIGTAVH